MSLLKVLDYLNKNPKVNIRRSADEITIRLGNEKDMIRIYPEERRAEFFDIDKTNERTLREKYYTNFPQLRDLFLKLVEEGYEIHPQ
jgi:hypothetical protein